MAGVFVTWPWTFGDDETDEPEETEHQALLDAMSAVLDPTEDTAHEIETWAHSVALAAIWDAGERIANQAIPERMLEALELWETALKIPPQPGDTEIDRRARVAAKLRGLKNNALPDIEATARKVLGAAFVEVIVSDPATEISYYLGGIPGPPGLEWYSSRAVVAVRMSKAGLTDAQFVARRAALANSLDALLPSWMSYVVGTESDFTCGSSIVSQALL